MFGIGVSPGISIGKAYILNHLDIETSFEKISNAEIILEIEKFEKAINKTKTQLEEIKEKAILECGQHQANIFDAHILILDDIEFVGKIKNQIKDYQEQASCATQKIMQQFIDLFHNMEDEYIKERASDIKDVGNRIIKNIKGMQTDPIHNIPGDVIIIANDITPSETIQLNKEKVLGFVTEIGGKASHAAIMSRSMGLPAVVGLDDITLKAKTNDIVIIDGESGEVILNPDQDTIKEYQTKKEQYQKHLVSLEKFKDLPAKTIDGAEVKIVGNIATAKDIDNVIKYGGQGIGLYRTELLFMDQEDFPTEEEQFVIYKEVLEKAMGLPTIFRTLDIGGDKKLPYLETQPETNPFLGLRAIRLCLKDQNLIKPQLKAILRASIYGQALIMYPFISGIQELRQANVLLREVKKELDENNIPYKKNIKVGIMVEIPSAALTANIIAKEVDFFSIGSNDLCQYTLAVDRMNEKVSHLYQPLEPSVLQLIKTVIDAAHREGIFTGMCGEMASDPISVLILLGLGLDEFSTNALSIPKVKNIIHSVTLVEAKEIANQALALSTSQEIKEMVTKKLNKLKIDIH